MAIYVKIGCISVKNGPIFNPKPPLESSKWAISPLKSMGVRLLGQVR